jgi:LysM repeat protein
VQSRMLRAAAAIAAIGLVAACEAEPPTPTALNGVAPDVAAPSPDVSKQGPVARPIVVHAGQSLSRIAAEYGVPQRTIIAANDLTPPYKIKIGQQLLIPSAAEPPPAPAAAGSPPPEVIPAGGPALPGSTAPPPTTVTANPAPPPVVPAVKPLEVAASAGDKNPEPLRAPVVPPSTATAPSSGTAELSAPATTAAVPSPTPVPAAAPPGVTCPSGTMGMWSEDIIKKAVYICRKLGSQS